MKKREHFVPQFYLKSFTDNNGLLHVFDRKEDTYFTCKPENICLERNLYETEWENANEKLGKFVLQNSIEDNFAVAEERYSNILKKLLSVCIKDQNPNAIITVTSERKVLISFIVNLYLRNPWTMKELDVDGISNDINENEEIEIIRKLLDQTGFGGTDSLIKVAKKEVYLTEKYEGGMAFRLCKCIEDINVLFFFSEEDAFTTCSFPAQIGEDPTSIGENHMCAFLPLSPHVAVLFGNYKDMTNKKNRMVKIETKDAMLLNKEVFQKPIDQIRYVIGNSDDIIRKCVVNKKKNQE